MPHPIVLTALVVTSTLACAHAQPDAARLDSTLRFRNGDIVTALPDGPPVPRPQERRFDRQAYFFDAYLGQRTVRSLSPAPAGRARNVNALDQVPDDSWFENRLGTRPVTPDDLRQGDSPRPPFRVVGAKLGGLSPGMRVRDASGNLHLLKFDRAGEPDAETATDVILQRLLWAAGYHTPDDRIIYLRAEDLVLDPAARLKDPKGNARRMTPADLRDILGRVGQRPDGGYRGLLSRYLPGVPVGGYPQEGVRPDDANDVVPHEDRRDLRGARVFFAWLNHVDIKEDNSVDTWVEDPHTPGKGHVRHHLIDFGNSLGIFGWRTDKTAGFTHLYDGSDGVLSMVSFGLWRRPWEAVQPTGLPAVGNLESVHFDPARWQPRYPWAPFERFDRFDGFWAARILMQFTPDHIAAAVAEGRYSDPRSAAYVARTLVERQRKLGRHYLGQVSALDGFQVLSADGGRTAQLCFRDLLATHFGDGEPALLAGTRHQVAAWDFLGRRLPLEVQLGGGRHGCVDRVPLSPDSDGYTILDVTTGRADGSSHRVLVHVARAPTQDRAPIRLRVIGVRRL
jgi:hypothetical protein